MLNVLFGSGARVKILKLLLLHPENRYYLRQIARELKLQVNSVRRELTNLEKLGLVSTEDAKKELDNKGEKKYFIINEKFVLFPELKALFVKAQIFSSQKFVTGLQKICQPKFLALTGVFTNYPEAMTDILLVGRVRRPLFLKLIKELEKNLEREVNFTILDEKEFKYRKDVMDIFLYNILAGKTVILINSFEEKE